jgi:lipooligosaccharide transport system permease protein
MLTNAAVSAAVKIAEKRAQRAGSGVYSGQARVLVQRNFFALRSNNYIAIISGFFEPVLYLISFGLGVGALVGKVNDGSGHVVSYMQYLVPALLATSAMNGAIFDSTFNVFFKMRFARIYEAMLATSLGPFDVALGEISWALLRGLAYALGFMCIVVPMGLIPSWWGVLAIPAALLIAFGFASVGMGVTSYMKNFQQLNWIFFFLMPMFLFSGTFYPITGYPQWLQMVVHALPLSQAVELLRCLTLGNLNLALAGHVAYFVVMVVCGLFFTTRRLNALFMR